MRTTIPKNLDNSGILRIFHLSQAGVKRGGAEKMEEEGWRSGEGGAKMEDGLLLALQPAGRFVGRDESALFGGRIAVGSHEFVTAFPTARSPGRCGVPAGRGASGNQFEFDSGVERQQRRVEQALGGVRVT
jgi:hypothetical protein